MDSLEYKEYHESFMKNNNGTSAINVFLHIVPTFFTSFHAIQIISLANIVHIPTKFLIEFVVIILSLILNVTVVSNLSMNISLALFIVTLVSATNQIRGRFHLAAFVQIPTKKPQFVSSARAMINIITAVCILAVDFKCFPRNLAKTETFGFGLMDVGVGLYVFGNGIIHKPCQNKKFTLKRLLSILVSASPLLVLGAMRFFVTKEIDYQQHVSEYGVHWNFFITLAFTKIFGTILMDVFTNQERAKYIAITILCCHEMMIHLGVERYVMSENTKRDTFISANREGIASIPGYIALYVSSIYMGSVMKSTKEILKARCFVKQAMKMSVIAAVCWKMIYVCDRMFGVSRRLANMGYVFWILSIGATMVALLMFLELFVYFINFEKPTLSEDDPITPSDLSKDFHIPYMPLIFDAINSNGLTFFLVANVLTGLVNIIFQTMLLDTFMSLTIITYYMFVLCATMVFLLVNKIQLKVW